MDQLYDFDKLNDLINSLDLLTGRKITLKDTNIGDVITNSQPTPYCKLIQNTESGYNRCMQCDSLALRSAAKENRPIIYRCHAGLLEVAVPIREREQLLAYLMIGQMLDDSSPEKQWAEAKKQLTWHEDLSSLKAAYLNTESIDVKYLRAYADVMSACASYIWMRDYVRHYPSPLARELEAYIDEHYMENKKLEDIASELNMGRTKLCQTAQEYFSCSVHELIRKRRMRAAKDLLSNSDIPVSEVAEAVGYSDSSYFVNCFKRHCNETPLRYRRRVVRDYATQKDSGSPLLRIHEER